MKNTLMFLMVSLLLAFSLTACGGGQTNGTAGDYDAAGQTGTAGTGSSVTGNNGPTGNGSVAGNNGTTGSGMIGSDGTANNGVSGGGLMDDARNALDDAGRAAQNTMDNAARNF